LRQKSKRREEVEEEEEKIEELCSPKTISVPHPPYFHTIYPFPNIIIRTHHILIIHPFQY